MIASLFTLIFAVAMEFIMATTPFGNHRMIGLMKNYFHQKDFISRFRFRLLADYPIFSIADSR